MHMVMPCREGSVSAVRREPAVSQRCQRCLSLSPALRVSCLSRVVSQSCVACRVRAPTVPLYSPCIASVDSPYSYRPHPRSLTPHLRITFHLTCSPSTGLTCIVAQSPTFASACATLHTRHSISRTCSNVRLGVTRHNTLSRRDRTYNRVFPQTPRTVLITKTLESVTKRNEGVKAL